LLGFILAGGVLAVTGNFCRLNLLVEIPLIADILSRGVSISPIISIPTGETDTDGDPF
jgi:hypothetical protein